MIAEQVRVQDTSRLPRLTSRERRRAAAAIPAIPAIADGRYLAVESGEEVVLIPLESAVTRIGRGLTADVHLDDASVSRRHALVVQREEGLVLLDDRSMNGTWRNGERIREAELRDGDVIDVGAVRLRYVERAAG